MENKVKCLDAKKMIVKSDAFFCELDGKYYSSEEGYKKYQAEKEAKKQFRYMNTPVKVQDVDYKMCRKDGYLDDKERLWSSKEAYLKDRDDKQYWTKSMDKLMEVLGYEKGMKLPTIAAKKFSEIRGFGTDCIYETICQCETDGTFDYPKTIDFNSEYQKVSYYTSIIVNRVGDVYKKKKREEKIEKQQQKIVDTNIDVELAVKPYEKTTKKAASLLGAI